MINLKVRSNDGRNLVLEDSSAAKPLLVHHHNYSLVNALNLSYLSELAYASMEAVLKKFEGFTVEPQRKNLNQNNESPAYPFLVPYTGDYKTLKDAAKFITATSDSITIIDTQAFHYNDGEHNVFVFRGTKEYKDFLADLFAPRITFGAGQVHKGFYDNFVAVKPQIVAILKKPENQKCKSIVTGHSLGGALATLVSAFLSSEYRQQACGQVMLYTFGSPRVGDKPWVDALKDRFIHFRHRRAHDPITMLPPHHSCMRFPGLAEVATEAAEGALKGAIRGVPGVIVGATTEVLGETIFNATSADLAFMHHGQGILLHRVAEEPGITKTLLNAETLPMDGKYLNGKEFLLMRELVQILKAFSKLVEPHSMLGYHHEIYDLVLKAIRAWDKDPKAWLAMHQRISQSQDWRLQQWQKAYRDANWKRALYRDTHVASPDATASRGTEIHATPQEKEVLANIVIAVAMDLKSQSEREIAVWSRPNAKDELLKVIYPGKASPELLQELRYHASLGD
jgi:Lipase (class 3)